MTEAKRTGLEQEIKLTAKLYEIRDAMRALYRDDYQSQIAEFQGFIRLAMRTNNIGPLKAMMHLLTGLQKEKPDSGMAQALLIAACVELVEPSAPCPNPN